MTIADYFGASERGPSHRRQNRPNEDAWAGFKGRFGVLIVVSDGLGSRVASRKGARSACIAVRKAVSQWHRAGLVSIDELIGLVEPLWRDIIVPEKPENCAATCLFALLRPNRELIVAGLGDGMAVVKADGKEATWVVGPRGEGFSNETKALGFNYDIRSWFSRSFNGGDVISVFLASDGVADDVLPERIDDFVPWVIEEFGAMAPRIRWQALRRALREWPTPHHLDDKTIAVLRTCGHKEEQ